MMYKHKHCSALKDHLTYMQILQSAVCLYENKSPKCFLGDNIFYISFSFITVFLQVSTFFDLLHNAHSTMGSSNVFIIKTYSLLLWGEANMHVFSFFPLS